MNSRDQKHLLLPQIGVEGQARIAEAKVLVVGAGGLGCAVLQSICGAGVGTIRLVDGDHIEETNLARQTLYGPADIGELKAAIAGKRLQHLNPEVRIDLRAEFLTENNADSLFDGMDLVLDCTDNYNVRYLIDDTARKMGTPVIHAALHQFQGQLTVFHHRNDFGFRSLYPDSERLASIPTCEVAGVYAILPAMLGLLQANEALKIILGIGKVANDHILVYDALKNELNSYTITEQDSEEHIQARSHSA